MASTMATQEVRVSLPMNGGDRANSYAQNSLSQRRVIEGVKGLMFQTIPENLEIKSSNTYQIADFGCSTGPNTFIAMQNIIDAVMLKHQSPSEFHVFFNDHIDNDFNTLFKTLPPNRIYTSSGVPGSFHNQLLPRASLHIAHCSYALHRLSKIPPAITDKCSPAWNKGKIYCAGNSEEVTKAYFAQFTADMDAFLKARAQELVDGGLMLIQLPGVPNHEFFCSQIWNELNNCLADMVKMEIISEEEFDSFNLPFYFPVLEELKTVIDTSNYFTVKKLCTLSDFSSGKFEVGKTCAEVRVVIENLMRENFGSKNIDLLFHLLAEKVEKKQLYYDTVMRKSVCHFAILKRKAN